VVRAWRVDGCRIAVDGWPATVRGEVQVAGGALSVRLDFDDWPRDEHPEIPEWWTLEDLARPRHAHAA
jgi:hypothetical protein